jgi:hypothetical protein
MSYDQTTLRPFDAENPVDQALLAQSAADSYKRIGGTQAIIDGMAKNGIKVDRLQAYDALCLSIEAEHNQPSLKHVAAALGIVVFVLGFFASPASATESKPCKETTTTTAKPHEHAKKPKHRSVSTTTVKPTTTTTETPKVQQVTTTTQVARKAAPSTTTTVEVATPEQIETTGEVNADDSIQPVQFVSSSTPAELAHTGIPVAPLALLAAALCGIGWAVLWLRGRLAR